jgi:hypothetical protein
MDAATGKPLKAVAIDRTWEYADPADELHGSVPLPSRIYDSLCVVRRPGTVGSGSDAVANGQGGASTDAADSPAKTARRKRFHATSRKRRELTDRQRSVISCAIGLVFTATILITCGIWLSSGGLAEAVSWNPALRCLACAVTVSIAIISVECMAGMAGAGSGGWKAFWHIVALAIGAAGTMCSLFAALALA